MFRYVPDEFEKRLEALYQMVEMLRAEIEGGRISLAACVPRLERILKALDAWLRDSDKKRLPGVLLSACLPSGTEVTVQKSRRGKNEPMNVNIAITLPDGNKLRTLLEDDLPF